VRYSTVGGPRRITDEQVRRLREWKPLYQLAKELGISYSHASKIRNRRVTHKQRSP
jgi:hypothetical protein